MNNIREQLSEPFGGLCIGILEELESVVKKAVFSFSTFLRENYHSDTEAWSYNKLEDGFYQDKISYEIKSIDEIYKIWQNEK